MTGKEIKKTPQEQQLLRAFRRMEILRITTLETLMQPEHRLLYADLWQAMEGFVTCVAMQTMGRVNSRGQWEEGTSEKVRILLKLGAKQDDLQLDCLVHIMERLDCVLAKPLDARPAYCMTMVKNCLVDEYRRLCPGDRRMLHLDRPVGAPEDDFTLADILTDNTNAEDMVLAREVVEERLREQASAETQRREQEGAALRNDLTLLNEGASVFTYLCFHEGLKPRQTTDLLLRCGDAADAAERIKRRVCRKYRLEYTEISALLDKPFRNSLKLETGDSKAISAEISRVKNRMPAPVRRSLKARSEAAAQKAPTV